MDIIRHILSDLKHVQEANENEYVSETEIYEFIIENCGYNQIGDSLEFYYIQLAAAAISTELIRQDDYSLPSFDDRYIIELLSDREEHEYHSLFKYYLGKLKYLKCHTDNQKTFFIGEDLKLEYNLLIKIFATIITADLNLELEKLKRHLLENVKLESWCNLILSGHEDDYLDMEKERIKGIIKGVLA